MGFSRRGFMSMAAALVADCLQPRSLPGQGGRTRGFSPYKVILLIFGGVRRADTFSPGGLENIPHLAQDLGPQSIFYMNVRNEGVTAHFNAISSILTGAWQRVDDWGKLAPTSPTLFEYYRKQLGVPQSDVWVVASNKALTDMIGASSSPSYGHNFGANVVFPKQLLINAVVNAMRAGRSRNTADRNKMQQELDAMLEESNYEGLGWSVFEAPDHLDPHVRVTMEEAVSRFVSSQEPTTGDELTFWVSREIMRRFAPSLLVVNFSDVEVAHFGSYSLHLAGIRIGDRLVYQLWHEAQENPEYRGKTTMIVLPEFGRDPDGSSTNGFLNHRSDNDSCRSTWMMVLGAGVERPQIIERPIQHVDVCPTLARALGCRTGEVQGRRLADLKV
jgi:hypothetical protein